MSSRTPNFGVKAMDAPLLGLRLQQLGLMTVITSSYKVAAKTLGCIAFTRAAASSQGFGPVTLRGALAFDFLQLAHRVVCCRAGCCVVSADTDETMGAGSKQNGSRRWNDLRKLRQRLFPSDLDKARTE